MKKLLFIFMLSIIVLSLCSCGVEDNSATIDSATHVKATEKVTYAPTEKETAAPTEKPTSPPTEPPTEDPMWKQAYIDKVINLYNESGGNIDEFNLIYVNGDNIPELYAISRQTYTQDRLCWYSNGQVGELNVAAYGFEYIPNTGYFISMPISQYEHIDHVYYFDGISPNQLFNGTKIPISGNFTANCVYEYIINGEEVSKSTYNDTLNSTYDFSTSVSGANTIYAYSEIVNAINNW